MSDKITVRLSTGKTAVLHALTGVEQIRADCAAQADPMKTPYYRIASSIKQLTMPDGTEVPILPVQSSSNLDSVMNQLKGRDQDELRRAYEGEWTPFMAAIRERLGNLSDDEIDSVKTIASVLDVLMEDSPNGYRVLPLTSGKKVALRELTARQQMAADSWTNGETARLGYYRTGMAVSLVDETEIATPETLDDLDAVLKRFTGLDFDELGSAYGILFSVNPEVLKNDPRPPSSDCSTQ